MGYEDVGLQCDETVSLGGINRKTGKANPVKIEGYFLGTRKVPDEKKKNGFSYIYVLKTSKGNVGVWGKTNLDRNMEAAQKGLMTLITQNGMQETKNGSMYKYRVQQDKTNAIDVQEALIADAPSLEADSDSIADSYFQDVEPEADLGDEEEPLDEVKTPAPARAALRTPSSADSVKAMLARAKNRTP